MRMIFGKLASLLLILLLFFCCCNKSGNLPSDVKQFRDDPKFYQMIRGFERPNIPKPTPENLDSILASWERVYENYIHELLLGFIAESEGRLDIAEKQYEKCLDVPVHEEPGYYTHLDLARIALKKRQPKDAIIHLRAYLKFYSQEMRAAAGIEYDSDEEFGYAPSKEMVPEMKTEIMKLEKVLAELQKLVNG